MHRSPDRPFDHSLRQQYFKAVFFLLLGELLLAGMMCFIKMLSETSFSSSTLVFYRNLFGLVLLMPIILWHQRDDHFYSFFKTQQFPLHLLRAASGVTSMYGFFYVIKHLPLAEASLVKLSMPIFLPIVAYYWLKETIHTVNLVAIMVGFMGVIIILKPGTDQFQFAGLIGLGAAALAAVAKSTIRKMGPEEPSTRIVFYFGTLATLISAIPFWMHPELPQGQHWIWLLLMGFTGSLGQISITYAYQTANPGKIGPYGYASIIYASLFGWLFWGEVLMVTTIVGSILIILSGWINLKKGH